MRSKEIETYKATLVLTSRQRDVLIGALLGDGHIEASPCSPIARLKVEQREGAKEYVEWLANIFKPWIRSGVQTKMQHLKTTGNTFVHYYFNTYSHPDFEHYRQIFYQGKRKIIPPHIDRLLTPLTLAVWFMDDGSIKSHECRGRILNTHCFTQTEVKRLCHVLVTRFGLLAWPRFQPDGVQIYISGRSAKKFQAIIEPYIIPMMAYKLPYGLTKVPKE